jgi:Fe2+ transport system protein B
MGSVLRTVLAPDTLSLLKDNYLFPCWLRTLVCSSQVAATVSKVFVPYVATVAVICQETRSWKWMALSVALRLVLSLAVGVAVYQVGRLL